MFGFAFGATPTTPTLKENLVTPVDYTLPYPGILPGNVLYPLKTFRDRVVSFFITDSAKQAEFDLLQADKRLAAGQSLFAAHADPALISQTISKGENYFEDAIINTRAAKKEGHLVNDFLDKLQHAGIKHEQVLYQMSKATGGQLHADLLEDIQRVQGFEEEVNTVK